MSIKRRETAVEERVSDVASSDEYNAVVDAACLENIILIGSKFEIQPAYFGDSESRTLSTDVKKEDVNIEEDLSGCSQIIHFCVEAKNEKEIVLSCHSSYLVVYSLSGDVCEAGVRLFVDRVALFSAYPYFRSRVAQYSWEAGADLPTLPIIKGAPRKSSKKS